VSGLDTAFATARSEGRAALVGYLPAGFPDRDRCVDAFGALAESGVDVFEIGLPYSDPLMDGPVIQQAVQRALDAGTTTRDVLATVEGVVARTGRPTLVMTYWNPVERYGPAAFARDLAAAGGVGVITPDLLPEEAGEWLAAADDTGLAPVFIAAPTSTDERLATIGRTNRGFVYAASTLGVTGARAAVGDRARELVSRLRTATHLPIAVGLGVSTPEQAADVAGFADGVIVGSAFVSPLLDGSPVAELGRLAAELRAGAGAPAAGRDLHRR
jgi:tryptophan synthase alpha chain